MIMSMSGGIPRQHIKMIQQIQQRFYKTRQVIQYGMRRPTDLRVLIEDNIQIFQDLSMVHRHEILIHSQVVGPRLLSLDWVFPIMLWILVEYQEKFMGL